MKVKELLGNKEMTFDQVQEWCKKKSNTIFLGQEFTISKQAPFKVSCERVQLSKTALFKKPFPIYFGHIGTLNAEQCPGLTSLAQLNCDYVEWLSISYNDQITSLEGCPHCKSINLGHTSIKSLKGINDKVEIISAYNLQVEIIDVYLPNLKRLLIPASKTLLSLKDIDKYCPKLEYLQINACDIKSHVLGLLKIKSLKTTFVYKTGVHPENDGERALQIVSKHLQHDRDLLDCQEELITNGLKEYAKL